jgi:hypothetical protein
MLWDYLKTLIMLRLTLQSPCVCTGCKRGRRAYYRMDTGRRNRDQPGSSSQRPLGQAPEWPFGHQSGSGATSHLGLKVPDHRHLSEIANASPVAVLNSTM